MSASHRVCWKLSRKNTAFLRQENGKVQRHMSAPAGVPCSLFWHPSHKSCSALGFPYTSPCRRVCVQQHTWAGEHFAHSAGHACQLPSHGSNLVTLCLSFGIKKTPLHWFLTQIVVEAEVPWKMSTLLSVKYRKKKPNTHVPLRVIIPL